MSESDSQSDRPLSADARAEARVDEVFDLALDLPADERAAFLEQACGDDAELRARVERLLALSDRLPTGLATAGAGELLEDEDEVESPLPERIGTYRVIRELGRGGMGVVYLGERDDGHFHQRVAIKVMRPGSDTPEARRRFEQERQIIASLQHANIARLYDGGVTRSGRPFSVMEHVEGKPINVYCDEHRLGVEERLRLVEVVGGAVHYAHQKLVVHRDLKPSNILVSADGQIKLLDFGIAKLLDVASADYLLMTGTGMLPVTPLYASPEQLQGATVTTASDVYQLGLLLFELLTGDKARRSSATPGSGPGLGMAPDVLPSAAVAGMQESRAEEVARLRDTRPRALVRTLRPELDAIVRAAMHPEPERRYPSAAELMADLRRYRRREPLSVRPDRFTYRAGRFLRRNLVGASLALLFVLLLVGYSISVTAQAQRIARERDRAERIQAFALGLYSAGDPNQALGPEVTAAQLVAHGVARAEEELAGEPDVEAEVKAYLGNVYLRLGLFDQAEPLLRDVVELQREVHGEAHPEVAAALDDLGRLLLERDDPEALELLEAALAQRRRFLGERAVETADSLVNVGRYYRSVHRLDDAERALSEGMDVFCSHQPRGADCADSMSELAWVMNMQERPQEAEELLRRNVDINLELHGEVHPEVATAWNNLAHNLWQLEKWQEGDEAMDQSLAVMSELYGDQHPDIASSLGNLAGSQQQRGDLARAAELYGQARAMRIEVLGARHVRVAQTAAQLAEVLTEAGRHDEAAASFEESLSIFREHLPADHPSFARLWRGLGALRLEQGDLAGARQALEASRRVYAGLENSSWHWRVDVLLARVDRLEGEADAARARLDAAAAALPEDDDWREALREERAALDAGA